jgi:hypothetical protein
MLTAIDKLIIKRDNALALAATSAKVASDAMVYAMQKHHLAKAQEWAALAADLNAQIEYETERNPK